MIWEKHKKKPGKTKELRKRRKRGNRRTGNRNGKTRPPKSGKQTAATGETKSRQMPKKKAFQVQNAEPKGAKSKLALVSPVNSKTGAARKGQGTVKQGKRKNAII